MPERLITGAVNAQRAKLYAEKQKELEREQRQAETTSGQPEQPLSTSERAEVESDASISKTDPRERIIVQMIIRHGEKVMCYTEDENGQDIPLSVAEYISYSLRDDDIQLQSPISREILQEAVENIHTPNFHAEQHFINHPDQAIRTLALQLGPESVELSNIFGEQPVDERLDEIIPNLIASYKLSIIQNDLKKIIEQMKRPDIKSDKEKYRQLMTEFSQKSLLVKELAKECGDRVVLK